MESKIDWKNLEEKYPLAFTQFSKWLLIYYNEHNLFVKNNLHLADLPIAMQFGIFLEYLLHAKRDVLSIAFSNRAKSIEYYMKRINEKLEREKKNEANSRSSNS